MSEHLTEVLAEATMGKAALGVGLTTATSPHWITYINGDQFQAIAMLTGFCLTVSLIVANVLLMPYRLRAAKDKAEYGRHLLKEAGIGSKGA